MSTKIAAVSIAVTIGISCTGPTTREQLPAPPPSPWPDQLPTPLVREAVSAANGMVVSDNRYASAVGREVLRAGGNAIDAAIATGFALAVVHPTAGNIGGGGFMVVRFPDGTSTAFDFREKAPLASHSEMFLDENGEYSATIHHSSHVAIGVPGTVAGFAAAHSAYGNAEWRDLVQPAVDLAGEGFILSRSLASSLASFLEGRMAQYPASVVTFSKGGVPYDPGDRFVQADLARTLERIMVHGRDGFYRGETARLLVEEMVRGGGLITMVDLERYEAKQREPIRGTYRGYDIVSMPPPSSGGVALVEMLNILEGYDLQSLGHNTAPYLQHLTEAMRIAYRDRAAHLADVDFVPVPVERLISKDYAQSQRARIDFGSAGVSNVSDVELPFESDETTHYSVVDASGMAVSVTYTLEYPYGSSIVVPGAGFLLNNEMGDFNARRGLTSTSSLIGTDPNLARPEQRMLSSMTPSIIAKDGDLVAVVGSPGGRTIINTVLQVTLNLIDFKMDIQEAVDAPRFHHQWLPEAIMVERGGVTSATVSALTELGYEVQSLFGIGSANSIMYDPSTGLLFGASDLRFTSDSRASGY